MNSDFLRRVGLAEIVRQVVRAFFRFLGGR
jgi:hypothetical protein